MEGKVVQVPTEVKLQGWRCLQALSGNVWARGFPFPPERCSLLTFTVCWRCSGFQRAPCGFPASGMWCWWCLGKHSPANLFYPCSKNFKAVGLGVKAVIEGNPGRKCEEEPQFCLREPVLGWTGFILVFPLVLFSHCYGAELRLFVILEFALPKLWISWVWLPWINPVSVKLEDFLL